MLFSSTYGDALAAYQRLSGSFSRYKYYFNAASAMSRSFLEVFTCLCSTTSIEQSRVPSQRLAKRAGAAPLTESTAQTDVASSSMTALQPEPLPQPEGLPLPTPFANVAICPPEPGKDPGLANNCAAATSGANDSSQALQAMPKSRSLSRDMTSLTHHSSQPGPSSLVSPAVRFADSPSGPQPPLLRGIMSNKSLMSSPAPGGRGTSRVRLKVQLEEEGTEVEPAVGPAAAAMAATKGAAPAGQEAAVVARPISAAPSEEVPDGEPPQPRALTQLASRLIAHDVDYRTELEALMAAHGAACSRGGKGAVEGPGRCSGLPRSALEALLSRHSISLRESQLTRIASLYGLGEYGGEEEIDGAALMRDLDRAAFRHLAVSGLESVAAAAAGFGGGGCGGGAGGDPQVQLRQRSQRQLLEGAASRRSLAPAGQLGDKARIVSLVSSQLGKDKSLCSRPGGGGQAPLAVSHIREVIKALDLTAVPVPVGTRARYVPASDDPGSFQVPVWSLRAMHRRKQERDRVLLGGEGDDSELRQLGQAGREALKKKITRRSLLQQEEIIASAVVAAARATFAPSLRHAENSIHTLSRAPSTHPAGPLSSVPSNRSMSTQGSLRPDAAAAAAGGGAGVASDGRPDGVSLPGTVDTDGVAGESGAARVLRRPGSRGRQTTNPGGSEGDGGSRGSTGAGFGTSSGTGDGSGGTPPSTAPRPTKRPASLSQSRVSTASLIGSGSAVGMEGGMVVRPVVVVAAAVQPSHGPAPPGSRGTSTAQGQPQPQLQQPLEELKPRESEESGKGAWAGERAGWSAGPLVRATVWQEVELGHKPAEPPVGGPISSPRAKAQAAAVQDGAGPGTFVALERLPLSRGSGGSSAEECSTVPRSRSADVREVRAAQHSAAPSGDATPPSLSTCSLPSSQLSTLGEQRQTHFQAQPLARPHLHPHTHPPPPSQSPAWAEAELQPPPLHAGRKPHKSETGLPPQPTGQQAPLTKALSSSCVAKKRQGTPPESRPSGAAGCTRPWMAGQGTVSRPSGPRSARASWSDPPLLPPDPLAPSLSNPLLRGMDIIHEDSETSGPSLSTS